MRDSIQCQGLAEAIEQEGLSPLPESAREHLARCADCQDLLADFNSISKAARELPAEVEPPARVWISLRAQLVSEGLIKKEGPAPEPARRARWWGGLAGLLQGRALATAAVGLLIFVAGAMQLERTSAPPNRELPGVSGSGGKAQAEEPDALTDSGTALSNQEHELRAVQPAGTLPTSSPVDDDLQKDLQTLNAFIADCQRHLKSNPHDQLAREYLAGALQQKAELLAEMMDRGRSVN
ncbi:MAG: anti-sigma factor [Candidatus Acidiferrum sp.]|jgi:ribosomal protein S15P/S13E